MCRVSNAMAYWKQFSVDVVELSRFDNGDSAGSDDNERGVFDGLYKRPPFPPFEVLASIGVIVVAFASFESTRPLCFRFLVESALFSIS